jgi:hypothetical protein
MILTDALGVCQSLRQLSLILLLLDYDLDSSNKRRSYSGRSIKRLISRLVIPNWRLELLEDFKCETRPFKRNKPPPNLDFDPLWKFFIALFPRLHSFVWNVPIQSAAIIAPLVRQKQLRHFASDAALVSSPNQLTKFTLSTLESLHLNDLQIFSGMILSNLLRLSAACRGEFKPPVGFTFTLLHSLELEISDSVRNPFGTRTTNFPVLKGLSITFRGPRTTFQLPDIPSLTEIVISTRLPTFSQGMEFCSSLIYEPWKFPQLEKVDLDSFVEWDILYLLLRRRNLLKHGAVSRIKILRLLAIPPIFYPILVPLLAGHDVASLPVWWGVMTQISIESAQTHLLDEKMSVSICI